MYVACRPLKVALTGDASKFRMVAPGDTVPEALGWPYASLIAHLNLEWIKWTGKESPQYQAEDAKVVPIRPVLVVTPEKPKAEKPAASDLNCPHCPGRKFKSQRGLTTHMSLKHSQRTPEQNQAG